MIQTLKIKNVALIKDISLDFTQGFNVLLGETGAGKSIIIDSINFVLGDKPSKSMIRTGENTMKVEASFVDYGKQTSEILAELGIDDEGILLFTRSFNLDGKSECRINGLQYPLNMLKQISSTLVDFYGQHENQVLLRAKNHLALLESYKPEIFLEDKKALAETLNNLKKIQEEKNLIGGNFENRERMIDLLSYQISEIENAKLKENEDELLENELKIYASSERISENLSNFISAFDGSSGVLANVKAGIHDLQNIVQYNDKFPELIERLTSSMYELDDVLEEVKKLSNDLVFDEAKMNEVDARLDHIKSLKRKYGPTLDGVFKFLQKSKIDLDNLENAEAKLKELSLKEEKLEQTAYNLSKSLSNKRRELSLEVEDKICKELAELGMKNARFKVGFNFMPNSYTNDITKQGFDNVEFLFSANLGEDLKPLSKTISGGEMSRFMLAMKNILADKDGVGTLVFDEVDAGISGLIGNAVAEKLAKLSKNFQVLCITHLPQVASMADSYIYVTKNTLNNSTQTSVEKLNGDRIIEQIAQLTGGAINTETSIAHARELKQNSEEFKKKIS